MFDRKKPYSTVDGDSIARYYQLGRYYAHDGREVTAKEASKPTADGTFAQAVEREVAKRTAPTEAELNQTIKLHDPGNRQNQPKANGRAEPIAVTEDGEIIEDVVVDDRADQLTGLKLKELNNIVKRAGGQPFRGDLAKSHAINWLLENTAA